MTSCHFKIMLSCRLDMCIKKGRQTLCGKNTVWPYSSSVKGQSIGKYQGGVTGALKLGHADQTQFEKLCYLLDDLSNNKSRHEPKAEPKWAEEVDLMHVKHVSLLSWTSNCETSAQLISGWCEREERAQIKIWKPTKPNRWFSFTWARLSTASVCLSATFATFSSIPCSKALCGDRQP